MSLIQILGAVATILVPVAGIFISRFADKWLNVLNSKKNQNTSASDNVAAQDAETELQNKFDKIKKQSSPS